MKSSNQIDEAATYAGLNKKITSSKHKRVQLETVSHFGGTFVVDSPQRAMAALFESRDPHVDKKVR